MAIAQRRIFVAEIFNMVAGAVNDSGGFHVCCSHENGDSDKKKNVIPAKAGIQLGK